MALASFPGKYNVCNSFRVIKQALRSSGANVADQHISDVSMCAMFMLEAAKRCDSVFRVPPKSTRHTVADSESDISKLQKHILQKGITQEDPNRTTPIFEDPTEIGLNKLTNDNWLSKHLTLLSSDDNPQCEQHQGEVDIDYEIADVL